VPTRADDVPGGRSGWRPIQRQVIVTRPFDDVWPVMAARPAGVLGARPAGDDGPGLEVRVRRLGGDAERTVLLHLGGFVQLGDRAVLPLSWADFGQEDVFPVLNAVLELGSGDDPATTRVVLVGRYRPPLGAVGRTVDCPGGAEVVAESVTTFLTDLAGRLESA